MRIAFIITGLVMVSVCSGIELQGRWKEDAAARQGLNDFLYEIGMNWFKRLYVRSFTWANEENIYYRPSEGPNIKIFGYSGPTAKVFSQEFVADNSTLTTVDMGEIGGLMTAMAFVDERDRLVVHMMKVVDKAVEEKEEGGKYRKRPVVLETVRTRKEGSRELYVDLRHVPSGVVLRSKYIKQG